MNRTRLYKYSGGKLDAFSPKRGDFTIDDIARGIAYRGRWCGQTRKFYSVAEHSIHVSNKCSEPYKLWGLLHDCGEAFFGDVPAPHKDSLWYHLPDAQGVIEKSPFVDREDALLHVVLGMAGAAVVGMPEEVQAADMMVRAWEYRELVCEATRDSSTFEPLGPEEALAMWLARYSALRAVDSGQLTVESENRLAV